MTLSPAAQLAAAIARAENAEREVRELRAELAHLLRAYSDRTEAMNLTRQRLDAALAEIGRLQGKVHDLLRRLWGDSSHEQEGGVSLDQGKEKAPENPTGGAG